ncbi:MAG: 2-hydroxychromene-2-carboxylate isomerase [Ideonella sp.]|nr:2-hydroxychromene-2-carboxylate isomerase [Ideonella sp.]MCC7458485.1 2-hydroxychromene-2-carboxylate isomerase [Nitrospira sp.]
MRPGPVEFWFDFISPYGYLASLRIDDLAARHGRDVQWHPLLVGVTVLRVMGLKPLMDTPLKKDYVPREIARYARRHGVTLRRAVHARPMNPLPAARALAWLRAHAPAHAKPFARAVFHAVWAEGGDVVERDELLACAAHSGTPDALIDQAIAASDAGALLRAEVQQAIGLGVFGSPFFIVDGEPFFGVDKLELLDEWLARGGW